jgi:NADH dehydrogenase
MLRFTGFPAWVVWAVVHIYFLIGFANRIFVMLQWVLTFLTKHRQVRIFPGQERPFDSAKGLAHDYASRSHSK